MAVSDFKLQWVVPGALARSCRPCYNDDPTQHLVSLWLNQVREMGIKSILCLLSHEQVEEHYTVKVIPLLKIYRAAGFEVAHVPVQDYQTPPLSSSDFAKVKKAIENLPKPWLIHCSAGIDRTGAAIKIAQIHLQTVLKCA